MTTNTAHKRLDEIETHLTPKEWAIRLAVEARNYPDALAYLKALAMLPLHELLVLRPYFAFEKQAAELHPGSKPDDIRARHRLTDALWSEFHTLKVLQGGAEVTMDRKVEIIGLQAALQFSVLHGMILREVLDGCPPPLAEWSHEITALLQDFYAHRAAVELIQRQQFDGQPILLLDLEAELDTMARTIESAVATANGYFNVRAERDGAGTNGDANNQTINLESIKASAAGQRAAVIAEKWRHDASHATIKSDELRWEQIRAGLRASDKP